MQIAVKGFYWDTDSDSLMFIDGRGLWHWSDHWMDWCEHDPMGYSPEMKLITTFEDLNEGQYE